MIAVENAIGLSLLEELCIELRARVELQRVARQKPASQITQVRRVASRVAHVLAILTSACLTLVDI